MRSGHALLTLTRHLFQARYLVKEGIYSVRGAYMCVGRITLGLTFQAYLQQKAGRQGLTSDTIHLCHDLDLLKRCGGSP